MDVKEFHSIIKQQGATSLLNFLAGNRFEKAPKITSVLRGQVEWLKALNNKVQPHCLPSGSLRRRPNDEKDHTSFYKPSSKVHAI